MLADAWHVPIEASRKTEQGIGLLWRIARGGADVRPQAHRRGSPAAHRPLVPALSPALAAQIDTMHRAFGAVWHIDIHSMPAVGDANADDPGRARADFVLGDRDGTTCAPEFTALVADAVRGMGYSVAINDPYKGVEIVRAPWATGQRHHSLQIELNRRLYMDEGTLAPNAHYPGMERDLERLIATVCAFVLGRPEARRATSAHVRAKAKGGLPVAGHG